MVINDATRDYEGLRTEYPNGDSRITYQKEGAGHVGVEYVHQQPSVSQFMQFKDGSARKWFFGERKLLTLCMMVLRSRSNLTRFWWSNRD